MVEPLSSQVNVVFSTTLGGFPVRVSGCVDALRESMGLVTGRDTTVTVAGLVSFAEHGTGPAQQSDAAVGGMQLDGFAADIVDRCRWAQQHNDRHPSVDWSTGEQLAVALVLGDRTHLDEMDYTVEEAAQRVQGGMASPPALGGWLDGIRAALGVRAGAVGGGDGDACGVGMVVTDRE